MKKGLDFDDLFEIVQDLNGIEALLVHLENSDYLKGSEEDALTFRAVRNSVECTKGKLQNLLQDAEKESM